MLHRHGSIGAAPRAVKQAGHSATSRCMPAAVHVAHIQVAGEGGRTTSLDPGPSSESYIQDVTSSSSFGRDDIHERWK